MKEIYNCTPSELDEQPEHILNLHWNIRQMERKNEWLNQKRQQQKSKIK